MFSILGITYNFCRKIYGEIWYSNFFCSIAGNIGWHVLLFALLFEEINLTNILLENYSIIYAGFLSGGIAFTLQMYAQKNIEEAPAAIIYSLEGVFAALAGWIILNQMLDFSNILGCFIILIAVILSQITPSFKKLTVRDNK